eukprot:gene19078-47789_t
MDVVKTLRYPKWDQDGQETEATNLKQFDKMDISQHLTEADHQAPHAGWMTRTFDGDARMMTVFDKTVMNMDICETEKGEKYIVPKYDSLLDPHLAYVMKAQYGVKHFLALQDIVAISDAGAPLRSKPLMMLDDIDGSALVYVPYWATGKNMLKQGAVSNGYFNELAVDSEAVHGAFLHGPGFTIVDLEKVVAPEYMHYKCSWRRQKHWGRQMTPEMKMDELEPLIDEVKQVVSKFGDNVEVDVLGKTRTKTIRVTNVPPAAAVLLSGVEMKLVNGSAYIQAGTAKQVNKAKEALSKYAPIAEWRAQMWKDCETQKLPAAWAAVDNDRPQTPRARGGGDSKSPDTAEKKQQKKKHKGQEPSPPKAPPKQNKGAGRGRGH